MKPRLISAVVAFLALFAFSYVRVHAQDAFTVIFLGNGTCTNTSVTYPYAFSFSFSVLSRISFTESINGSVIGSGYGNYAPNNYTFTGNTTNSYPFSASQPYTYSINFTTTQGETTIGSYSATFLCEGGVLTLGGTLPPTSGTTLPGPGVPASFVLRSITCNSALFNLEGNAIGSNAVKAGQSFFVNPKPTTIKDRSYTELFAGSYVNGFIPTSCVGGKPAGYAGS